MFSELSLNGSWRFKGFPKCDGEQLGTQKPDYNDGDWLLGQAPGTVHTDLMANNLIPDPFKGLNQQKVQWVPQNEWWYRKEFELSPEFLGRQVIQLVFEGLDTYATVWVNDVLVGEANNMFTPWRFNIKKAVKAGKNVVAIRFKPVYQVALELEKKYKGKYGSLHAKNFSARPYVRKAQYSFGWDWGPTLPTAGIWRETKIVSYNTARLGYFSVLPLEVSKEKATVKLIAEVHAAANACLRAKFLLWGFGQKIEQEVNVEAAEGTGFVDCAVEVFAPKLWWPRGYGEPALYDASVELYSDSQFLGSASGKVGIRSIELLQEPDEEGTSFIFKVNGQRIFCRGADWIPADSFLPRVTPDRYRKLLELAAEANFNMLRVWGGGVYEDDAFYDLCDRLGIMVWQDFMYACAAYPEEEWFLKDAQREAELAVLRLRGHACVVVWCGNNEIQWHHKTLWKDRPQPFGLPIFTEILPSVLSRLDGTRPYRPSTPYDGEVPNSERSGTRHNWIVWSKHKDYPAYLDDKGRFLTEFGWQAPPSMALLSAYLDTKGVKPDSAAFKAHEKQTGGLGLLRRLLSLHYPVPRGMKRFVLYSQLNQADALKTAVTHWRSRMFKTSGCLIWQLNDCWPVVSWSLVDYGLYPKPAYFAVKRAFQPVIAPLIVRDGVVHGYVVNESAQDLELTFRFEVLRFNGETLYSENRKVAAPAYSSILVLEEALEKLPIAGDCVLAVTLEHGGLVVFVDAKTAGEPKDLKLPLPEIQVDVRQVDDKTFEISLQSPVYAKAVYLEVSGLVAGFSDNFFDLLPLKPRVIKCFLEKVVELAEFRKALMLEAYPYE